MTLQKKMRTKQNSVFFAVFLLFLMLLSCSMQVKSEKSAEPIPTDAKPFLGIGFRAVSNFDGISPKNNISRGLQIIYIAPYSAAYKAGLKTGDIIISYDSSLFPDVPDEELETNFRHYIQTTKKIGDSLLLSVIRTRTTIKGKRNNDNIHIKTPKEMNRLIDHQLPGQIIHIESDKQLNIIDIIAVLDRQPGILTTPLPANSLLFPEFENHDDPYAELTFNLIKNFQLHKKYNELIKNFHEDERWDDGFRLSFIRYIRRDPLKLPAAAYQTATKLERVSSQNNIGDFIQKVSRLLDVEAESISLPCLEKKSVNPEAHIDFIKEIIKTSLAYRNKAFEKLTAEEQQFLSETLPDFMKGESRSKAFSASQEKSREKNLLKIIDLAHKTDFSALSTSAMTLGLLTDRKWLVDFRKSIQTLRSETPITIEGIQGDIIYASDTPAGMIVIGGNTSNRYSTKASIIIDLGGDDIYLGNTGAATLDNPISILIDFSGNDKYSASEIVSFGSGCLGAGILIDVEGDDVYTGSYFSQGTGLMGAGLLIECNGNDHYMSRGYAQGTGIFGIGFLLDHDGNDHYQSDVISQGVGGPKAIGVLIDMQGEDTYYATGKKKCSYGSKNIYNGMSQGFGFGFRNYTSGGIGLLIDSQGKDLFHAGNFSQGGGYFFGLGILKNSGMEDDTYIGSRYAQGFSAHSAAGILIDDGGNDHYSGYKGALQSAAWDKSAAALIDKKGNDTYNSQNLFFSKSASAYGSISLFIDGEGEDNYLYTEEKLRPADNKQPRESSLSVFIDNGGEPDVYNGNLSDNNTITCDNSNNLMVDLDQDVRNSLLKMNYKKLFQQ